MGKVRRCDARCHNAKKPKCRCWCGGKFHGAEGAAARDDFKRVIEAKVGAGEIRLDEIQYMPDGPGSKDYYSETIEEFKLKQKDQLKLAL